MSESPRCHDGDHACNAHYECAVCEKYCCGSHVHTCFTCGRHFCLSHNGELVEGACEDCRWNLSDAQAIRNAA
jgi:hypothetical protein